MIIIKNLPIAKYVGLKKKKKTLALTLIGAEEKNKV
jgi:hypothetical protein